MIDQQLLNVLDWCKLLDGQPTPQQIESVRQVCDCHMNAKSVNAAPPITAAELLTDDLLYSTHRWASAIGRENESEWWRQEHATALDGWRRSRKGAELAAYGHINASTLVALERAAEPLTAPAPTDDTVPPMLDAVDFQTAFERGWTGVPSQEPGHSAL